MNDKKKFDTDELVVQNIMKYEDGRGFIYKHLLMCNVFDSTFNNDSIQHAYQAGKRKAGLQIVDDLKQYAPEYYVKMIQENM